MTVSTKELADLLSVHYETARRKKKEILIGLGKPLKSPLFKNDVEQYYKIKL